MSVLGLSELCSTKNRFSSIKSDAMGDIDAVNDALMMGAIMHLSDSGFRWVEVPILTKITGACENVDTLYKLDHFGAEAYLAQTGQLYLEAKIPMHKKLWTIITSSRAEDAADSRHLNQFQLIEFEHQGDLEMLLENIEKTVQAMVKNALEKSPVELDRLDRDKEHLKTYLLPFNRITYTEAVEQLSGTYMEVEWGEDLKAKHENYLVKINGDRPLFITHYPKHIKFFNMKQNEDDSSIVNSADLILPFSGESVGSAERENDYKKLIERLSESSMFKILEKRGKSMSDFEDYLNIIRQHPILHSGCGIGFTRVSQSVLGFEDIRMATNYPVQRDVLY